jgi:hypothetical protein
MKKKRAPALIKIQTKTSGITPSQAEQLTGGQETTLHSHPGGSGGLTQQQILRLK